MRPTLEERFWSKVAIGDPDQCWTWKASTDGRYGYFGIGRAGKEKAHRVSWRLKNGEIPTGMHVLHKCDNPICVNPAHLFLGTQRENLIDAIKKKRFSNQCVGPDETRMLEVLKAAGFTSEQIAKAFCLNKSTVDRCLNGTSTLSALQPDAGQHYLTPEQWKFCYDYACRLLKHRAPQCECFPDLPGVMTQLDNLLTGLVEKEKIKPIADALFHLQHCGVCDGTGKWIHENAEVTEALAIAKSLGL